MSNNGYVLETKKLNLWYGTKQALMDINIKVAKNQVTALIGPSGCGKTTLLRCFNRMNDLIDGTKINGEIVYNGKNILDVEVEKVRKENGMVFQKPNPFPKSIWENIAYGPQIHGVHNNDKLDEIIETSLKRAALWDEVYDRLEDSALSLSGGQQQRLCIARALSVEPSIILMDEPCSALDPIATGKIEDLIQELSQNYTVIIVTHNMQQAARVSDYTGFMYLGKMIEFDRTTKIFESPSEELTENYITGRFG
jgi:phosphate transport system ATP-binding protein